MRITALLIWTAAVLTSVSGNTTAQTNGAPRAAAANLVADPFFRTFQPHGLRDPETATGRWGTGLYSRKGLAWVSGRAQCSMMQVAAGGDGEWQLSPQRTRTALRISNSTPAAPHVYGTTSQRVRIDDPQGLFWISLWAQAGDLSPGAVFVSVDAAWRVRPVVLSPGTYGWRRFSGLIDARQVDTAPDGYLDVRLVSQDRGIVDITGVELQPLNPQQSRFVHAFLVIDSDSNLGESVVSDGNRMEKTLLAGLSGRAKTTKLSGLDASPENLLAAIRNLSDVRSDTVLVYYAGHGGIHARDGHTWTMGRGDIRTDDVVAAVQATGARLSVVLSDCCSNVYGEAAAAEIGMVPDFRTYADLLLKPRGIVCATAASPGESAWGERAGGLFTRSLYDAMITPAAELDHDRNGAIAWAEYFDAARRLTQQSYRGYKRRTLMEPQLSVDTRQHLNDQADQTPYAIRMEVNSGGF
jgi:hypothetical protein